MTSNYDRIIKHLGHKVYLVNARGSSGEEKPRAWIKCMRCDEIIVMAIEPRVTVASVPYEVSERSHDEATD